MSSRTVVIVPTVISGSDGVLVAVALGRAVARHRTAPCPRRRRPAPARHRPANTQPFGTSTANDMIAAAMMRMITAVQAATLCPWSTACSLMPSTFVAGVDDPVAHRDSVRSGRSGPTRSGRRPALSSSQSLATRSPRGPARRRPRCRRAPRSAATGRPSGACPTTAPTSPSRADQRRRRRATQGQIGRLGHRLDRAGAAHPCRGDRAEHALGVEQRRVRRGRRRPRGSSGVRARRATTRGDAAAPRRSAMAAAAIARATALSPGATSAPVALIRVAPSTASSTAPVDPRPDRH